MKTKQESKEQAEEKNQGISPYLGKGVYDNYAKAMKEKNQLRVRKGLTAIPVRTFEQWSAG